VGTEASLDQVYAEVKRMRLELKSLEKSLESIAERLIPEEKVTPEELRELVALKKEALSGECVCFEDVLKKHGAKSLIQFFLLLAALTFHQRLRSLFL
jgi:hypothetical protein